MPSSTSSQYARSHSTRSKSPLLKNTPKTVHISNRAYLKWCTKQLWSKPYMFQYRLLLRLQLLDEGPMKQVGERRWYPHRLLRLKKQDLLQMQSVWLELLCWETIRCLHLWIYIYILLFIGIHEEHSLNSPKSEYNRTDKTLNKHPNSNSSKLLSQRLNRYPLFLTIT